MSRALFAWHAAGAAPEGLNLSLRNGLVCLTVRGEPMIRQVTDPIEGLKQVAEPGPVATLTMPLAAAVELTQALLKTPPVADMIDAVPYVCWFDTPAERDAFVRGIQQATNAPVIDIRDTS